LKTPNPAPAGYPGSPKTVGEHLKKRRIDLKLTQTSVAFMLKCDETSVHNWEKNLYSPSLQYYHRIIEFLGYVPEPTIPKSLGERIVSYRKSIGLSQEKLARRLGIDPGTLSKWEREKGNINLSGYC
jgi:transcriptional regulator with XRE-family HTH domain